MNPVAEEMMAIMTDLPEDTIKHIGVKYRSGRYPYGSGDNPYQHTRDFVGRVEQMRKEGMSEKEIADTFEMTTGELRQEYRFANDHQKLLRNAKAKALIEKGLSTSAVAREMGVNESSVRGWLKPNAEERLMKARQTADYIRERVDKYGMVDVGGGVELELGVSKTKFEEAIYILEREGYEKYQGRMAQPTNKGQGTTQTVLCKPGTQWREIYELDKVHALNEENYVSHDNGETFVPRFVYPKSLDSSRLMIRYPQDKAPDGSTGADRDGVIELRRGVADLSLGRDRYSQVRILVDNDKYLKGMAVYSDDMPDGIDVIFNTSKQPGDPKVLKSIKKDDPNNPFGSLIKDAQEGGQYYYTDADGKKQLGLINKRACEGDWDDWDDALPSQFLSKQSKTLAKKQLGLARADKQAEFNDICALENPTLKKHLLEEFASSCDAAAVHLKAAALPGQKYHVILPVNTLKDTEVYAPKYPDGSKLALIRYPHGGTFEIPILTVNNRNPLARKFIDPDATDAIGVNSKVAARLSGADFDGDTVMCIPTNDRVKIESKPYLERLEGFDPHMEYAKRDGMRFMKKTDVQKEMGTISNLITDMTLSGASDNDLADAVRHSMVVIDAYKHELDYKRSEIEHNIEGLKQRYQIKTDSDGNVVGYGGAATLISKAKSKETPIKRQGTPKVNLPGRDGYDPSIPDGALIYKTSDKAYYVKRKLIGSDGKEVKKMADAVEVRLTTADGKRIKYDPRDKEAVERYAPVQKRDPDTGKLLPEFTSKDGTVSYKVSHYTQDSTKMAETHDATTLISAYRYPMEIIYAEHANSMKSLANQARLEIAATTEIKKTKEAADKYSTEVASLKRKLNDAELNRAREREAIRRTNAKITSLKKEAEARGEEMGKEDVKKASQRYLSAYRDSVGAISRRERNIDITDKEWEAIQAGAVSPSYLKRIFNNTDTAMLRQRAMPRETTTISPAKAARIKTMSKSCTVAEIAAALGLSTATVTKYLKGENE